MTPTWIYDGHRAAMKEAVMAADAAAPDGRVSREYAATLYILTGMEYTWARLKKHTGRRFIDCEMMIEKERLSTGEELLVGLAGNLFNGRTYTDMEPIDLISDLDNDMFRLSVQGIILRRNDIYVAELN